MGDVAVSQTDWKTVSALAKEGQKSRSAIRDLRKKTEAQTTKLAEKNAQLQRYGAGHGITDAMRFYQAQQRAPQRIAETIADVMRQPPEQQRSRSNTRDKRHEQSR